MLKLNITAIGANPRTIITAYGPKQNNYLKAREYNDKFLNFFVGPYTLNWKVGDEIEVLAVEEKPYVSKKDGSNQIAYNIKLPKSGNAELEARVKALEETIDAIKNYIKDPIVTGLRNHNDRLKALEPKPVAKVMGTTLDYPLPENEVSDPDNMANFDPDMQSLEESANEIPF